MSTVWSILKPTVYMAKFKAVSILFAFASFGGARSRNHRPTGQVLPQSSGLRGATLLGCSAIRFPTSNSLGLIVDNAGLITFSGHVPNIHIVKASFQSIYDVKRHACLPKEFRIAYLHLFAGEFGGKSLTAIRRFSVRLRTSISS
jgi:hypothetical protein